MGLLSNVYRGSKSCDFASKPFRYAGWEHFSAA